MGGESERRGGREGYGPVVICKIINKFKNNVLAHVQCHACDGVRAQSSHISSSYNFFSKLRLSGAPRVFVICVSDHFIKPMVSEQWLHMGVKEHFTLEIRKFREGIRREGMEYGDSNERKAQGGGDCLKQ